MKKIVFRADGSSINGLGHIMRCVAIAEMLKENFMIGFATFESDQKTSTLFVKHQIPFVKLNSKESLDYAEGFDAVVLDGYWYDNSYVNALKNQNKKVIQVDDLGGNEFYADIVINHAIGADYATTKFHNCKHLLLGSDYALIRSEFLNAKNIYKKNVDQLESVTINMGGADPQNYTLKLVRAIEDLTQTLKLNVVIGSAYSHKQELESFVKNAPGLSAVIKESLSADQLVRLLQESSLFICACSTVVYEALAVKLPIACFLTAENQRNLYSGLMETKAVEGLGDLGSIDRKELGLKLSHIFLNYGRVAKGVAYHNLLIDKRSGERIAKAVLTLWN